VVRDAGYLRGYFEARLGDAFNTWNGFAFAAARPGEEELCGYLVGHLSSAEIARQLNIDRAFTISEIGVESGCEGAIAPLLSAVIDKVAQGRTGGRAFVPREPAIDEALSVMFDANLHDWDDRNMMARPLGGSFGYEEIEATFKAPGAFYWLIDEF
jgi:hypothetical protein